MKFDKWPVTGTWARVETDGNPRSTIHSILTQGDLVELGRITCTKIEPSVTNRVLYIGANTSEDVSGACRKLDRLFEYSLLRCPSSIHVLYMTPDHVKQGIEARYLGQISRILTTSTLFDPMTVPPDGLEFHYRELYNSVGLRACTYNTTKSRFESFFGPETAALFEGRRRPFAKIFKMGIPSKEATGISTTTVSTSKEIASNDTVGMNTRSNSQVSRMQHVRSWAADVAVAGLRHSDLEPAAKNQAFNNTETDLQLSEDEQDIRRLGKHIECEKQPLERCVLARHSLSPGQLDCSINASVQQPECEKAELGEDDKTSVGKDLLLAGSIKVTKSVERSQHAHTGSSPVLRSRASTITFDMKPLEPIPKGIAILKPRPFVSATADRCTGKSPTSTLDFTGVLVASLVQLLPRFRAMPGKVRLRTELGRICLGNMVPGQLADNLPHEAADPWRPEDITQKLNAAKRDDIWMAFTRILSTAGNDADYMVGVQNTAGEKTWTHFRTQILYDFTCRAKYPAYEEFVVEADGSVANQFTYAMRHPEQRRRDGEVWIHCLQRSWDMRMVLTHDATTRLEARHGDFAKALLASIAVP
jgi:hypothetical protein